MTVDPYGAIATPTVAGFNQAKPEMLSHVRLYKAIEVVRLQPDVILLGTSRVEWGLDPQHPIFSEFRPYNLGFSGANMSETLQYFKHALANQKRIKKVVLGLDFFMFDKAFTATENSAKNILGKRHINSQEYLNIIFSIDALKSSYKTVKKNIYLDYPDHRVFRGMARVDRRRSLPGSDDNFTQWIRSGIKFYPQFQLSSERLKELQELVELCRQNRIELKVFVSPIHATQMEAIRISQKWEVFENWKREVAQITPFWDFSGYNSITTEPVSTNMKNYIDSSHYRETVGDLILNRLFSGASGESYQGFGVWVTPQNIESHLERVRQAQKVWIGSHPQEVKLVEDIQKNPYQKRNSEGRIF